MESSNSINQTKSSQKDGQLENDNESLQQMADKAKDVPFVGNYLSPILSIIYSIKQKSDAVQNLPQEYEKLQYKLSQVLIHMIDIIDQCQRNPQLIQGLQKLYYKELKSLVESILKWVNNQIEKTQNCEKSLFLKMKHFFQADENQSKVKKYNEDLDQIISKYTNQFILERTEDQFPQVLKNQYKGEPGYNTWKYLFKDQQEVKQADFSTKFNKHNELNKEEGDKIFYLINDFENESPGFITFIQYMNFVKKNQQLFDIQFQKLNRNMINSLLNDQINEEKDDQNQIKLNDSKKIQKLVDKNDLNRDFLNQIEEESVENYDGLLAFGFKHGQGTLTTKTFTYKGSFVEDKMEGYGEKTNKIDMSIYQGFFKGNQPDGLGHLKTNQMIYEGYWKNGIFQKGIIINEKEQTIQLGEVHPGIIPLKNGEVYVLNLEDYSTKYKATFSQNILVNGSLETFQNKNFEQVLIINQFIEDFNSQGQEKLKSNLSIKKKITLPKKKFTNLKEFLQFMKDFKEKNQELIELQLDFSWNKNKISDAGAKEIAQNFKHLKGLTKFELGLGENGIQDEGAKEIAQNFKHLEGLTQFTLYLEGNEISADGAKEIAQNFIHLKGLTQFQLYLGNNGISGEGAKEIAQNFIHLKGLKQFLLNLAYNGISADGAKKIAKNFKHLKGLTKFELGLGNNGISGEGAKEIAQNFIHLKGLTQFQLYLRKNQISADGAKEIAQNFIHLKGLELFLLDLTYNRISKEALQFIKEKKFPNMSISF